MSIRTIIVGEAYPTDGENSRVFEERHFDSLAKYLTATRSPFFQLGPQKDQLQPACWDD